MKNRFEQPPADAAPQRWKQGDRVEVRWSGLKATGVVVRYWTTPGWPTYVCVKRDDGIAGSGPGGTWCASDANTHPAPAQVQA